MAFYVDTRRLFVQKETPQPCNVKAQSGLAPAPKCSTSCPQRPKTGSAIFCSRASSPSQKSPNRRSGPPESLRVVWKPSIACDQTRPLSTSLSLRPLHPSPGSSPHRDIELDTFPPRCRHRTAITMFSRAARLTRAAPIRAFASPSIVARRSVTTNAASAQVASPVPEVCFLFVLSG